MVRHPLLFTQLLKRKRRWYRCLYRCWAYFDPSYAALWVLILWWVTAVSNLTLANRDWKLPVLIDSGAVDLVVVDSVCSPGTTCRNRWRYRRQPSACRLGWWARLCANCLLLSTKRMTIAIFINPAAWKVGVMFGNPETTPGGRALKFSASSVLDVSGNTQIKGTGDEKDTNVEQRSPRSKLLKIR